VLIFNYLSKIFTMLSIQK